MLSVLLSLGVDDSSVVVTGSSLFRWSTASLFREATITPPLPFCECMRWDHTHTRVLRSEKGCRIRVTHVHACSDCVCTRDDTVRLDYASRFVRVIYSSHIVSIKLGTVTHSETNSWKSSRISTKKVTTTTVTPGNRQGFCV